MDAKLASIVRKYQRQETTAASSMSKTTSHDTHASLNLLRVLNAAATSDDHDIGTTLGHTPAPTSYKEADAIIQRVYAMAPREFAARMMTAPPELTAQVLADTSELAARVDGSIADSCIDAALLRWMSRTGLPGLRNGGPGVSATRDAVQGALGSLHALTKIVEGGVAGSTAGPSVSHGAIKTLASTNAMYLWVTLAVAAVVIIGLAIALAVRSKPSMSLPTTTPHAPL